jgi:hypothetical protein
MAKQVSQRHEAMSFSLWADSFHEGEWACRSVGAKVESLGGTFSASYLQGFIPCFDFELDNKKFKLTVYGNYSSWDPQPQILKDLLAWGKPDLVLIREDTDEILLAVEETAATPTGNQALQRCERQFGSAKEGFPFWYLIAEFGLHSDGGVRRDSIWPTLMGLELMAATQVASIVLHYSDLENPESYSSGKGMNALFQAITQVLLNVTQGESALLGLEGVLKEQIDDMVDFVKETWMSSLYVLPDLSHLNTAALAKQLCSPDQTAMVMNNTKLENFLSWPTTTDLTKSQQAEQKSRPLMKSDPFATRLERDLDDKKCFGVIRGSGSKPQKPESVTLWIQKQNEKHAKWQKSSNIINSDFSLTLEDFPRSPSGAHHLITAQRILYLYDKTSEVVTAIENAFPRLKGAGLFSKEDLDLPSLVYISNSMKPGRIFGDPYTGQLSAYSVSFGALSGSRKVVAYFPHQSVAQAAEYLVNPNNKGLRIMAQLTDVLLFGGGLAIKTKTLEIL